MRVSAAVLLVASSALVFPAGAQWRDWDAQFDEESRPWKEVQAQIPPPPKPESLVRVQTGTATSHQFYVDTNSISLGEDGVVRYTVVIKTVGGATNVRFEGMRCETREQKLYALGRSDNTWVRARDPKWQRVVLRDLTPHHHTLYYEYFCPAPTQPTPPRLAVNALKRGYGLARAPGTE